MKTFWLECFIKVANLGSFSEAAEELFISQSVLSKNIKALEDELGATLFERTTRNVSLTAMGKHILPNAKSIVNEVHTIYYKTKHRRNEDELNIITCPVMHSYGLANLISLFKKQNPEIVLQISESERSLAEKRIKREPFNFAIMRDPISIISNPDKQFKIIDDELAILCNVKHPFAQREEIGISQIRSEELLIIENGYNEYKAVLKEMGCAELLNSQITTLSSSRTVGFYVSQNWGVALISKYMAMLLARENDNLVCRSIREHPFFSLYLVALNPTISRQEKQLIEFVQEQLFDRCI